MRELEQKIKQAGLDIIQKEEWKEENITYYDTKYCYKTNGNIIARYFIVPCDAKIFREKVIGEKHLVDLIERPKFYEMMNDLSWNLYLVCVMETEEYNKLEFAEKQVFLDDDDYSRKILVTYDDFLRHIPNGKIIRDNKGKALRDPVEMWQEKLVQHGLKFCMDSFHRGHFEDYIYRREIIETEEIPDTKKTNTDVEKIHSIDCLKLTKRFRPDCYGADYDLPFKGVNLLDGNNGAGKTSVLEAIELIITGEIRKADKVTESVEMDSEITLLYNGTKGMRIPNDPRNAEKRNRERSWYGYRTDRKHVELNDAFHVYNFFSAEQTFINTYQQKDSNIDGYLTAALFGNEIRSVEENIKRYKKEFYKTFKENQAQISIRESKMSAITSRETLSMIVVYDYLRRSYLNCSDDISVEELMNILNSVQIELQAVEDIGDIPTSGKKLSDKLVMAINNKTVSGEELAALKRKLKILEQNLQRTQECEQNYKDKLGSISKMKEQVAALSENKKILLTYLAAPREFNEWINLCATVEKESGIIVEESSFWEKYNSILNEQSWEELSNKIKAFQRKEKEKKELEEERLKIRGEIARLKSQSESVENTIKMIRDLGKSMIEQKAMTEECPLCGSPVTTETIARNLEKVIELPHKDLQKFLDKEKQIAKQIEIVESELAQLNYAPIHQYEEAKEIILHEEENVWEEDSILFSVIQNRLLEYQKKEQEFIQHHTRKAELEKIFEKIFPKREYEKLRKNFDTVMEDTRELLAINNLANCSKEKRAQVYYKRICDKEKELSQEGFLKYKLQESKEIIQDETKKVLEIRQEIERYEKKKTTAEKREKELVRIQKFYKRIKKYTKSNYTQIEFGLLKRQIETMQNLAAKYIVEESNRKECCRLQQEINELKQKNERCEEAIAVMESLNSSTYYAREFINANMDHISEIFQDLHGPKEFDGLKMNEKGEFSAVRKGKEVPLYRLSTGQKSAVVLAIFFNMCLLMESTPNFIMLDEPVSNIDDLNTISLLDFLREVYLTTGHQIFFTTANNSIAKLFRRKFSFLEEDFCELHFKRTERQNTVIDFNIYDQEKLKLRESAAE